MILPMLRRGAILAKAYHRRRMEEDGGGGGSGAQGASSSVVVSPVAVCLRENARYEVDIDQDAQERDPYTDSVVYAPQFHEACEEATEISHIALLAGQDGRDCEL